jgi:Peptidase family S41
MTKPVRSYFLIAATMFTLTGVSQSNSYDPRHLYSINELQTDFNFLRATLEKTHPDLYLYTPKEQFNLFFDSLYKCIVQPLSELEFYNLVTLINSKLKDGHTMLLPGEEAGNYFTKNAKFFPFYLAILNNRLYVSMNCSADTSIKDGAELLRINGRDTKDIVNYLVARQIKDGNNRSYPIWILTTYFKEYFSFSFGHPDTFSITCKTRNGYTITRTIHALPKDSILFYRQSKYPARDSVLNEKQGIIMQVDKQLNIATLTIKTFDNEILRSVYKQNFDSTIREIFNQIYKGHIKNLILDIRNNQGGDFGPGKSLLSYLLLRSIKYLPYSKESEIIKPKEDGFRGNLYVLINGGSFSSTAILSSYLESTRRGVFIGEETAGNKIIISGDPIDMVLPNTKITFEMSTTRYRIRNGYNSGHGIIPNYHTTFTIDNIISGKDITKELAASIISKNKT